MGQDAAYYSSRARRGLNKGVMIFQVLEEPSIHHQL